MYSFGLDGRIVWTVHILVGLYFMWLGYKITEINVNNNISYKIHGIILIVLGVLMSTYHAHLWYVNYDKKYKLNHKNK